MHQISLSKIQQNELIKMICTNQCINVLICKRASLNSFSALLFDHTLLLSFSFSINDLTILTYSLLTFIYLFNIVSVVSIDILFPRKSYVFFFHEYKTLYANDKRWWHCMKTKTNTIQLVSIGKYDWFITIQGEKIVCHIRL